MKQILYLYTANIIQQIPWRGVSINVKILLSDNYDLEIT